MFSLLICLLSASVSTAATSDLETLALEISKLGNKMDSFQSFMFQDILSIKDKINKMDSKIDAMSIKDELTEETDKASSDRKDQETVNDIIEPKAIMEQLDRIKRGFKEEKEGIRHALDSLKDISQDLLAGKDQITEYLSTLEESTKTFLSDIHSELKEEIVGMTTHVQSDFNTSMEHSSVKFDESVQTLNGLIERTDTICKYKSDTITDTLKTAIGASERNIVEYLNNASQNTATTISPLREDINTVMENTADSNLKKFARLANATSKHLNGMQGRIEVLRGGVWGTVCDDGFDINDAKVACKMIDMKYTNYTFEGSAYYGHGTGQIWFDSLSCNGDERCLFTCESNCPGTHDCTHTEDVGVACWY